MSVNYAAAIKTARLNAAVSAIDANAAPATLEIGTAGMAAVLATMTLSDPSFTVAADVATLAGVPKSAIAVAAGTAAAARIKDGGGTVQISGLTVGTSGADINLNNVAIALGQTVTLSAFTITHAP